MPRSKRSDRFDFVVFVFLCICFVECDIKCFLARRNDSNRREQLMYVVVVCLFFNLRNWKKSLCSFRLH